MRLQMNPEHPTAALTQYDVEHCINNKDTWNGGDASAVEAGGHTDQRAESSGGGNGSLGRNQCPVCYENFHYEKDFINHMLTVHGSSRPFMCDVCGIYLSYRSSLYNHKRTHSDHRPFVCTLCGAKFRWKNSLDYHAKKRHSGATNVSTLGGRPAGMEHNQHSVSVSPSQQQINTAPPQAATTQSEQMLEATKYCPCGKRFYLMEALVSHSQTCSKRQAIDSVTEIVSSVSASSSTPTAPQRTPSTPPSVSRDNNAAPALKRRRLAPPPPSSTPSSVSTPSTYRHAAHRTPTVQTAQTVARSAVVAPMRAPSQQPTQRRMSSSPALPPPVGMETSAASVQRSGDMRAPAQTNSNISLSNQQLASLHNRSPPQSMSFQNATSSQGNNRPNEHEPLRERNTSFARNPLVASISRFPASSQAPAVGLSSASSVISADTETSEQQMLTKLCAKQEIMIRRLDGFEIWVQEKIGKIEQLLSELVSDSRRRNQ